MNEIPPASDHEPSLRARFQSLRLEEHALSPAFSPPRGNVPKQSRQPWSGAPLWLPLGAAAAVALTWWGVSGPVARPSLADSLPVLLQADGVGDWLAGVPSRSPAAPSDSLLPSHLNLSLP